MIVTLDPQPPDTKFKCNILAVVQQYDIIKNSVVRGAMIGNSFCSNGRPLRDQRGGFPAASKTVIARYPSNLPSNIQRGQSNQMAIWRFPPSSAAEPPG